MSNNYLSRPNLMHPDYLELLKTMPRAADGTVKDLHYVPPAQVPAYENAWRSWCREHPDKSKWPLWLHKWAEGKRRASRRDTGDQDAAG